jgi:hypothetical protein
MLHQVARYSSVLPLIEEVGGGTLLDVGSGSEGVAGWLGPAWRTTAIDRSFDTPGAMRGPHGGTPRMVVGDGRELPFADGEFDVVLALDVMEHIAAGDRDRAIDELVRTARRRLIVACPAGSAALAADRELAAGLRSRGMPPPGWLLEHEANGFPEPNELRSALEGHGRLRLIGNENLRWHDWLFRFEFRSPGFHFSRSASETVARWLVSGPALAALGRAAVRVAQGPPRGPYYRTIAVLDRR